MSNKSKPETTNEMLYNLNLIRKSSFSNSDDFKHFIKLSLLETGLRGHFSFERGEGSSGSGCPITRNYHINPFKEPLYIEKDMDYESKPSQAEIFEDMKGNLVSWVDEDGDVSVDSSGKFQVLGK